jgi:hypothetical protein
VAAVTIKYTVHTMPYSMVHSMNHRVTSYGRRKQAMLPIEIDVGIEKYGTVKIGNDVDTTKSKTRVILFSKRTGAL